MSRDAKELTGVSTIKASLSRETWAFVLVAFSVSRLVFFGAGALAVAFLPQARPAADTLGPPGFLSYWARWDGAWYSQIAAQGYGEGAPVSTAFFPLYPLLVRLGTMVGGGPALWGVMISLVSTLFALFFVYRLAERLYDRHAARATTLALAFFPTAFFLNAVYTEALFLALTAGSVWAARVRRNLLLAGLLGLLAAATRNLGVLLVIPLFLEWSRDRRAFGARGLAGVALVPVGLLGYMGFLWARFGDPFVSARQQGEHWGRELSNPFVTAARAWSAVGDGLESLRHPARLFIGPAAGPALEASNAINVVFVAVFLILLSVGFSALPTGLWAFAALTVLLPVLTPSPSFPLMSQPRFFLGAFPIFLVLGYLLSRRRTTLALWLAPSILAGVALTALFVTWRWVA